MTHPRRLLHRRASTRRQRRSAPGPSASQPHHHPSTTWMIKKWNCWPLREKTEVQARQVRTTNSYHQIYHLFFSFSLSNQPPNILTDQARPGQHQRKRAGRVASTSSKFKLPVCHDPCSSRGTSSIPNNTHNRHTRSLEQGKARQRMAFPRR